MYHDDYSSNFPPSTRPFPPLPLNAKSLSTLLSLYGPSYSYGATTYEPRYTASPDSFALSSPSSYSSFSFSDVSSTPSSSSLDSPFSLAEDLDLAYHTSGNGALAPSPPPLFLSSSPPPSDHPVFSPSPCSTSCCAFGEAFLPTACGCDKTLAPSLFDDLNWASLFR